MLYEEFLFTRNQQRDFTAFIRPSALTNKEISTIASALNYVSDIAPLTAEWPALYCFPIGEYIMLLRHYDSGRTHAGRSIPTVEGIAVRRTRARRFARALPHFLGHQQELLAVSARTPDMEALTVTQSVELEWPDVKAEPVHEGEMDNRIVDEFAARLTEDRLFVPFDEDGLSMLEAALSDPRFPSLYFAFGTNADVVARLNKSDIDVDIVSYFNTTIPSLRNRQTNEVTGELEGYVSRAPRRAQAAKSKPPASSQRDEIPEAERLPQRPLRERTPASDSLRQYHSADEGLLTPREMARREREKAQEIYEGEDHALLGWFGRLIARLLGRR